MYNEEYDRKKRRKAVAKAPLESLLQLGQCPEIIQKEKKRQDIKAN